MGNFPVPWMLPWALYLSRLGPGVFSFSETTICFISSIPNPQTYYIGWWEPEVPHAWGEGRHPVFWRDYWFPRGWLWGASPLWQWSTLPLPTVSGREHSQPLGARRCHWLSAASTCGWGTRAPSGSERSSRWGVEPLPALAGCVCFTRQRHCSLCLRCEGCWGLSGSCRVVCPATVFCRI